MAPSNTQILVSDLADDLRSLIITEKHLQTTLSELVIGMARIHTLAIVERKDSTEWAVLRSVRDGSYHSEYAVTDTFFHFP